MHYSSVIRLYNFWGFFFVFALHFKQRIVIVLYIVQTFIYCWDFYFFYYIIKFSPQIIYQNLKLFHPDQYLNQLQPYTLRLLPYSI